MYWVAHRDLFALIRRTDRGLVYLLAFLVARAAPVVSLAVYAAMPVLCFLGITVLRRGRQRDREFADFTCPPARR
jgi:hypothetical protein